MRGGRGVQRGGRGVQTGVSPGGGEGCRACEQRGLAGGRVVAERRRSFSYLLTHLGGHHLKEFVKVDRARAVLREHRQTHSKCSASPLSLSSIATTRGGELRGGGVRICGGGGARAAAGGCVRGLAAGARCGCGGLRARAAAIALALTLSMSAIIFLISSFFGSKPSARIATFSSLASIVPAVSNTQHAGQDTHVSTAAYRACVSTAQRRQTCSDTGRRSAAQTSAEQREASRRPTTAPPSRPPPPPQPPPCCCHPSALPR